MTENTETQPTIFEHFKNIFTFLFKKQYQDSFNEFLAFARAIYEKSKDIYVKYIKGQYIVIQGKRVPRVAIVILCVSLLYLISPMSCLFSGTPQPKKSVEELSDVVVYQQNGLKLSMKKCGKKMICGDLQYDGEQEIDVIRVNIRLFSKKGTELAPMSFDLNEENLGSPMVQNSNFEKIEFPVEQYFGFFKIDVQIDPEDEENEYEEVNED